MATLSLSAGSVFEIPGWKLRGDYPNGTTAWVVFTDAAGGLLGQFNGTVTGTEIAFLESPDAVAHVPHGANFQLFVQRPGGQPECKFYGTVVRKEPRFPLATVVDPESTAQQFKANFVGNYIGPMWKPVGNGWGSLGVHTWLLYPDTPSMGPNYALFSSAAARWLWSLNMDSVTINVKVLNAGAGKFNIMLCGDYELESWLGVQFETGLINNKVHVVTGDGPLGWDVQKSVDHTTESNDVYTVKYNFLSNTVACYEGTDLTPVIDWEDEGNLVPHGEGFRYVGLGWSTSLLSPGVEPIAWEAKDGV